MTSNDLKYLLRYLKSKTANAHEVTVKIDCFLRLARKIFESVMDISA